MLIFTGFLQPEQDQPDVFTAQLNAEQFFVVVQVMAAVGFVGYPFLKKLRFDMRQHLGEALLHLDYELLTAALFVEVMDKFGQRLMNLLLIAGLQEVMPHSMLHGAAGIIEILVAGQHDKLKPGVPFTAPFH
ncbi:hypothetical protein D3C87_1600050 [compost metagenome]